MNTVVHDREQELLREAGELADRIRDLRASNAVTNKTEVAALTGELRTLWQEIRVLRAPPVAEDASWHRVRAHYD